MKCAAVVWGRACGASSEMGVGWLTVVTPDARKYHLCTQHKLGGEVCVTEAEADDIGARLAALREMAAREALSRRDREDDEKRTQPPLGRRDRP